MNGFRLRAGGAPNGRTNGSSHGVSSSRWQVIIAGILFSVAGASAHGSVQVDAVCAGDEATKSAVTALLRSDTTPLPSVRRPTTVGSLLENLKLAWDKKLLVRPAFYETTKLTQFFNAATINWVTPQPGMQPDLIICRASVILDKRVFPGVVANLYWRHQVVPAQRAAHVVIAPYTEDAGQIEMNVESVPAFTWGAARSVFGSGGQDAGVYVIAEGGQPAQPAGKAFMRYLNPGDDPAKFGASLLPLAGFLLKQGSIPEPIDPQLSGARHTVQETDIVKFLRIYESEKR